MECEVRAVLVMKAILLHFVLYLFTLGSSHPLFEKCLAMILAARHLRYMGSGVEGVESRDTSPGVHLVRYSREGAHPGA